MTLDLGTLCCNVVTAISVEENLVKSGGDDTVAHYLIAQLHWILIRYTLLATSKRVFPIMWTSGLFLLVARLFSVCSPNNLSVCSAVS